MRDVSEREFQRDERERERERVPKLLSEEREFMRIKKGIKWF